MDKIAFDWQGTLDENPALMEMARTLRDGGWEVWIISAMPIGREVEREKAIADGNIYQFPWTVVYHSPKNYHESAGQAKIEVMQDKGINLLVDDNEIVCKMVRKAGMKALLI